jgi:hypothetical protein
MPVVEQAVERLRKPGDGTQREIGTSRDGGLHRRTPRRGKRPRQDGVAQRGVAREAGEDTPKGTDRKRE